MKEEEGHRKEYREGSGRDEEGTGRGGKRETEGQQKRGMGVTTEGRSERSKDSGR